MFASLAAVCLAALVQPVGSPMQTREGGTSPVWTVTLSAVVDGSGVFTFSEDSVTYTHRHWEPPKHVLFNGKPWENLRISPKEWTLQRGKLDLSHAWLIRRQGRDVVALEKTATGFTVHVADSPNGADSYSLTIAIPLREDARQEGQTASREALPGSGKRPHEQFRGGTILQMTFEPETFISKEEGHTQVADLSGLGNHAIIEGATPIAEGRVGAALQFDGKASLLIPTLWPHLSQDLRQLSVVFWVFPADVQGQSMIFDVGFHANNSITLQRINDRFRFNLPGSVCESASVQPKHWYHVVGVWNGTDQKLFVNGRLVATAASDQLTLNAASVSAHAARIGAQAKSPSRAGRYFRGSIDEVAIFNRALSDEEIKRLFQLGSRGEPLVKPARTRSGRDD